jgi:hypothetical protein
MNKGAQKEKDKMKGLVYGIPGGTEPDIPTPTAFLKYSYIRRPATVSFWTSA